MGTIKRINIENKYCLIAATNTYYITSPTNAYLFCKTKNNNKSQNDNYEYSQDFGRRDTECIQQRMIERNRNLITTSIIALVTIIIIITITINNSLAFLSEIFGPSKLETNH